LTGRVLKWAPFCASNQHAYVTLMAAVLLISTLHVYILHWKIPPLMILCRRESVRTRRELGWRGTLRRTKEHKQSSTYYPHLNFAQKDIPLSILGTVVPTTPSLMPANFKKHKHESLTFPEVVYAPMLLSCLMDCWWRREQETKERRREREPGVPIWASRVRFAHRW
jgi:hypothetical protein